jgi:metallo-beta-lactamase family protein
MSSPSGNARLTFLGGAGTVTGSKYLIETGAARVLLDCGLFQGLKALRLRNWAPFPFDPRALDAVVLSHAHLDHAGALPRLVRDGFRGPVFASAGTADLLSLLLVDSARIQEEDAARANRYRYTKHAPALPLYTEEDARAALSLVKAQTYGAAIALPGGLTGLFRRAGHILGASTVELTGPGLPRIVFSGDLGRWNRPILRDPELVPEADVLLVESTYGDRDHPEDAEEALAGIVRATAARGGAVIIPAFAVGRTQELLLLIRKLEDEGRLPLVSVHFDSPLGAAVTDLYCRHPEDHDLEMALLQDEARCPLCSHRFGVARTADESKRINRMSGPMIIVAGSGMATGGRILHHLKHRLPDHRNTILLTGFQAAGTRGRALAEGAREIKIHGELVPVRAEVATLSGLSAHADRADLLRWLRGFRRPPRRTFVVHGEPGASAALAATIREELGWRADAAQDGASVSLDDRLDDEPT